MPKGKPKNTYTGEFKQQVVETMRNERWSCRATAEYFGIHHRQVQDWERIYLTEGPEMLYIDRRDRGSKGRPRKLPKEIEEDLLAENQRLRAELEYLKNCKTKGLAACITQTASPLGCLNNLS